MAVVGYAGIASDVKQGDHQHDCPSRPETNDQNSIRESLVSSFKKNIYLHLKSEIQQNCIDTNASSIGKPSCRSK